MVLSSCLFANQKLIARLFISVHFVYELQDKILRFNYWKEIIDDNSGHGILNLIIVIVLLTIGCTSLLTGKLFYDMR